MKKILITAGIVVAVLLLIAVVVPSFIDANQFKPTLEGDLSTALGRKVDIGNLKLSLWSGAITVDQVSIADDPAFSSSPFLTANQLKAGVAIVPLIFSRRLEVLSFTISQPQVSIIRSAAGTWNFSSLGAKPAKSASAKSSNSSEEDFSVQRLTLTGGKMTVTEAGGKTREYDDVQMGAENLSYTTEFPFEFSANTPGNGTIKLSGQAGPINPADAALTPLHATIDVSHLDLASTGFVDPASGLGGIVDFSGSVDSDGKLITSKGGAKAQSLKMTAGASAATVPVNLDYEVTYDPKKQSGTLKSGTIQIGKATAAISGTFDNSGNVPSVDLKLVGTNMPVPDLEGVLPAVGVKLPSGASLQSGTLETTQTISGPIEKLVITGPVSMSNAKLAGFDLKGALGAISSLTGLGGGGGSDTEIQTFKADMRIDPTGQHAKDLLLVVPSIGTISGNGDASASGDLNCKMVASLAGAGAVLTDALGGGKSKGVPFMIKGTTSHPEFVPDVGGMAKGFVTGDAGTAKGAAGAAGSVLGSVFGKKK